MESIDTAILSGIYKSVPRGSVFFAEDLEFTGFPPDSIRWALARIVKSDNGVVRLGRGVYCLPKTVGDSGKLLMPSTEVIARGLASRWKVRIAPCGAQAAYLAGFTGIQLGPDTYVSDGSDQEFHLNGGRRIVFTKRKSMKVFRFTSERMRNLSEGMRFLGKEYFVDRQARGIVAENLSLVSDGDFRHDVRLCPIWIRELLVELMG